jgi:hypothetical protein
MPLLQSIHCLTCLIHYLPIKGRISLRAGFRYSGASPLLIFSQYDYELTLPIAMFMVGVCGSLI